MKVRELYEFLYDAIRMQPNFGDDNIVLASDAECNSFHYLEDFGGDEIGDETVFLMIPGHYELGVR